MVKWITEGSVTVPVGRHPPNSASFKPEVTTWGHLPEGQDACVPEQRDLWSGPSHGYTYSSTRRLFCFHSWNVRLAGSGVSSVHSSNSAPANMVMFENKLEAEIHPVHDRLLMPLSKQTEERFPRVAGNWPWSPPGNCVNGIWQLNVKITKDSDPTGMKVWVSPLGQETYPAEVLHEDNENLHWVMKEDSCDYQIGPIPSYKMGTLAAVLLFVSGIDKISQV